MSGCKPPSRHPPVRESFIQDGDTASFYGADLTEEAYNDPLPDIVIAHAVRNRGVTRSGRVRRTEMIRATRRPSAIARAPYRGRLFPGLNCTRKHPSPFQAGP